MILPNSPQPSRDPGKSYSTNCIDLVLDGPGDNTVRPCRPSMLAFIQAERDKIARWAPLLQPGSEIVDVNMDGEEGPESQK